jgi:hypothetical protein
MNSVELIKLWLVSKYFVVPVMNGAWGSVMVKALRY